MEGQDSTPLVYYPERKRIEHLVRPTFDGFF